MKTVYRILRFILVSALCLIVVVPGIVFVALSLSGVQRQIADVCESELTKLLDSRVTVGDLGIVPFNRVILRNVTIEPVPGDTAITVKRIGAGVRLFSLLSGGPLIVDYVGINGLKASVWRDSADAPLNIQPIITALSPKDRNKSARRYAFAAA